MLSHAHTLLASAYVPFTCNIAFNEQTSKKDVTYKGSWKRVAHENALDFCHEDDNAMCIATGPSDVYVIDADHLKPSDPVGMKDGFHLLTQLIQENGLPQSTPRQTSGSGGLHLFFSLSKSLHEGLAKANNRSKIKVDGHPTSLDSRADGGCIFVSPTTYSIKSTGEVRSYTFTHPLCPAAELPPMPSWLIDLLNNDTAPTAILPAKRKIDSEVIVATDFPHRVKKRVETSIANTILKIYDRTGGMDFTVVDKTKPCTICGSIHSSNSWKCRSILDSVIYVRNYSQSCRMLLIDYRAHPVLRRILETPTADDPIVMLLSARMSAAGRELRVSGADSIFYCFDGQHWTVIPEKSIQQELRLLSFEVLDMLCKGLASEIETARRNGQQADQASADLKQFAKAKLFIQKAGNVAAITQSARQLLWDVDLAEKLDTNPDLLGVTNGIIELSTGTLREGRPGDYVSTCLDLEYQHVPAPEITAFMADLFNGDMAVVAYMQRLLGYAITGHTREQVWAIWTGCGSNGKSLLLGILNDLLEPICFTMPREVLFDSGRRQTEGGPTPHLIPLIGKRLGTREEKHSTDVLNEECIKQATGQSRITARNSYSKEYRTFTATHLPVLICNALPKVDVEDAAMLRRLIVVPFNNVYTSPDDPGNPYNASNPRHRLKDNTLAAKLSTLSMKQQLLSWLVEGAKQWYEKGLGAQPQLLSDQLKAYISDNDQLSNFIQDHCIVGADQHINAAEFRAAFMRESAAPVKQEDLKKAMAKRGFKHQVRRVNQKSAKIYVGLTLCGTNDTTFD